ncbi:methyltransferase RsmF C-terminal domain-like protein [Xylanibacter ruminicola]|uniref:NOL1/NOP2/sun family protein n=1 Tax=Xylanibacter ruminicola (strain ATCC 19189 / DSM 19721 / CIP 105475 / JCM 8958 / 23) TaxID=264731 RepID=D5ESI8_XYLR2|nr:NOL1/NOP2/sun family protein [Xylanibacter ruminicola 23]
MNLPADFVAETRRIMGDERYNRFVGAFDEEAPTSIRVNPRIAIDHGPLTMDHSDSQVPWCSEGYYLNDRPQFTFDPLLHAGCYYVQEASSMFVTHILRNVQCSMVNVQCALDLCAAPGGKSTALRSVLPDDCVLISNEPMGNRAQILLENVTKWGGPNHIVTNNYPRDFRKAKLKFDLILCDVPCSGEGMFRKDPNAISEWSAQNVEKCWQLQREIVADAWECLNPGGLLIYSTCTYNTKENEENIRWILDTYDAQVLDIPVDPSWNITGSLLQGFNEPVYRFIPGITRGEGLFVCALRKRGNSGSTKNCKLSIVNSQLKVLSAELEHSDVYVDVPYAEALKYLRGEALVLPADTPRGIVTITYQGQPLGPAKNIGNRANNLYPKAWRIKSTHLPSEPPEVLKNVKI